jgi:hypothetical protein
MDDSYRTKNKYKTRKGGKKRTLNTLYREKVYDNPFDARKAADDEDRQNLKETRAVQAKEMNHGGEAVVKGAGIAIKGTGFKGVF